ncbi:NAD(P)/FAD-dependent oxidoreductase [Amycolatopsis endophytica]|uniref:Cation diffusion facilitator CzcD-associated flavoprotein CzcO n=1 Tax=Amycolatopsis endophytica TaxID=860233 RepID=A0A853BF61_9PSEU|nr:NAD(P)/FAD-dependent oxidoreductase [Amycolatopsis endophytica]NYI93384.1 cation diffusion facilitator CzcD-associated flavoprotein CzcO [Amycolatopsis endophytica]
MPLEHVDVLIVGAGLSGIGAAAHLRADCPGKSYAIFEARGAIGGTWDLFRYPGVRSDSDMFTLGYSFEPWTEAKAIADGKSIREYVQRTARERGIDRHIRFHHRVVRAEWSSAEALWTVEAERSDTGERVRMTCGFLFVNSGYYRYDQGYTPEFPGQSEFTGRIVHPQHWPEDLDYTGKRVVVIGSGATAVTLLPAMSGDAEHVTMLQRSPSYVLSLPGTDPLADRLRGLLPPKVAYPVVRWKNVLSQLLFFQLSRRVPGAVRKLLRKGVSAQLPRGFEVDTHFSPSYDPWDQRLCFVPDGDLFKAVRSGKAGIVTDTIDTFTPDGIRLSSGRELEADVVVTATGLNLLPFGGLELVVDGEPVEIGKTLAYKGMMLSGVPNYAFTIGYTNASWTLKADLVAGYVCRLLNHLDSRGLTTCTPVPPPSVEATDPLIDLKSGYVLRSIDKLPKQGPAAPWRLFQNYPRDVLLMRRGSLEDDAMRFSRAAKTAKESVA